MDKLNNTKPGLLPDAIAPGATRIRPGVVRLVHRLTSAILVGQLIGCAVPMQFQALDRQDANPFGQSAGAANALRGEVFKLRPGTPRLPDFSTMQPFAVVYATRLNVPRRDWRAGFPGIPDSHQWFALDYRGRFSTERGGNYVFQLASDDGSKLLIDDQLVIDNDGQHGFTERAAQARLEPGEHTIRVQYFQGPPFELGLQLFCAPAGWPLAIFPGCGLTLIPR